MAKRLSAVVLFLLAALIFQMFSPTVYAETAVFNQCENALGGARFRHTATKIVAGPFKGKVLIAGGDSESAATPTNASAIYSSCFISCSCYF